MPVLGMIAESQAFGEPRTTAYEEIKVAFKAGKKRTYRETAEAKGTHSPTDRKEPAARNSQRKCKVP